MNRIPVSKVWSARIQFASLIVTNAGVISVLYWNQTILDVLITGFRGQMAISLLPMTPLVGFALGVSITAFVPSFTGRVSINLHIVFLLIALALGCCATDAVQLSLASFLVGFGAGVAPRLLAAAGQLAGPAANGTAIGRAVFLGLAAVLVVRLAGHQLASTLGFRSVYIASAGLIASSRAIGVMIAPQVGRPPVITAGSYGPCGLWRTFSRLRYACVQQAALFAAFHTGWITVCSEISGLDLTFVVLCGGGAGMVTALLVGPIVDQSSKYRISNVGAICMSVSASLFLPIGYYITSSVLHLLFLTLGMALLDSGMQIALVANQTCVQALEPRVRNRLAATVTTFGFAGGAVGASIGHWLWLTIGWPGAVGFAALSAGLGLLAQSSIMGRQAEIGAKLRLRAKNA